MEDTYWGVLVITGLSVLIGVLGIVKGAPLAETAVLEGLISQNSSQGFVLPMTEAYLGIWWGLMSVVIGTALSYGFFWDKPFWPERLVMIPSIGFITLNFSFSIYMAWGILNVIAKPSDVMPYLKEGTLPIYGAVVFWVILGLATGLYKRKGDSQ